MDLFKPYEILRDDPGGLYMAEPAFRAKFLFFFFRIFPFILASLLIPVLLIADIPLHFRIVLGLFLLALFPLMLFKVYITEIRMSRQYIEVVRNTIRGKEEKTYMMYELEKITVSVYAGKGGGIYYRMQPKQGRSLPLLTIPRLYMSTRKVPLMNEKIVALTGLAIETRD